MAGPVPQKSAVESSSSQAPKEDLVQKGASTPWAGDRCSSLLQLVWHKGLASWWVRWERTWEFSAGFYFLLQLFLEVSPLQVSWVPAVELLLDAAASLCAVTWWARPASQGRTSVPSTAMPLAGLLPRWFLVFWWVFHICSSGAGAKNHPETKDSVWGGEGWAKCLETDHNSQVSKMPHSIFLMDSTWLQQDPAETPDSPLQLFPPCVLQLSWCRAPQNSDELKEDCALTVYLLLVYSHLLTFPGCFLLTVVVSA